MDSSTRESRHKRPTVTRSSTKSTSKSVVVEGQSNVLGNHNRALHVTGNVYINVAPAEQLDDAERELLNIYRASSKREQQTIHSVARLAASFKESQS